MELAIEINKCHGINSLKTKIDFNGKPVIVHAPNGTFKTSFCKTLKEWTEGIDSYDVVTGVAGSRFIKLDGKEASCDEFVIFSDFSQSPSLNNSKGVLLNPSLKVSYDTALSTYVTVRDDFLSRINKKYKINKIESVITRVFNPNSLDDALNIIHRKLSKKRKRKAFTGNYSDYFSDTIAKNISKPSSKQIIDKYQKIYRKTLKESFIKEGVFDLYNLINVSSSLSENNYFEAGNQILLKNEKPITTMAELESFISSVKNNVSKDPKLQEAFISLESDFSKKGMNKVANNIKLDPYLAKLYKNYDRFEESYLLEKFNSLWVDFDAVYKQYKISKNIIKKIKRRARKDDGTWKRVVNTFNSRFKMPFKITIDNKPLAVLGVDDVVYKYKYEIGGQIYDVEEDALLNNVLSEGETRVFALLNTIFKIAELEKIGKHKVLIFDDVADAFDYSNKHAIIEYLSEISSNPLFDVLVLTHNFDFYRHFGYRVSGRSCSKFASSDGKGNIAFSEGGYLRNIYVDYLRPNAEKPDGINHAIAIVPFARAVSEMTSDDNKNSTYEFLTEILHYRPGSGARLTGNSYAKRIEKLLDIRCASLLGNKNKLYKIIYEQASKIASSSTIDQKIEEKIVLSMAMRIFGEKYMFYHLRKNGIIEKEYSLDKTTFGKLFELFKKSINNERAIKALDLISIFTPVEIHVNGFAYEPLIDYSIVRLRNLFKELDLLLGKTLRPR